MYEAVGTANGDVRRGSKGTSGLLKGSIINRKSGESPSWGWLEGPVLSWRRIVDRDDTLKSMGFLKEESFRLPFFV